MGCAERDAEEIGVTRYEKYMRLASKVADVWMATVVIGIGVLTFVLIPLYLLFGLLMWVEAGAPIEGLR